MTIDPAIAGQTAAMLVTYSRHFTLDTATDSAQDAGVTLESPSSLPSNTHAIRRHNPGVGVSPSTPSCAPSRFNDRAEHSHA